MKERTSSMKKYISIMSIVAIMIVLNGCSLHPKPDESEIGKQPITAEEEKEAIREEEEVMSNAPQFSKTVKELSKELSRLDYLEEKTQDGLCLFISKKGYFEIQVGQVKEENEPAGVIYYMINSSKPSENSELVTEFEESVDCLLTALGEQYTKSIIDDSLNIITKQVHVETIPYSEHVELFVADADKQIDFRICPL